MARAIDHLVLCVRDLDQACAAYQKLGFTVTPRAVHPFGTGNALIQLDGLYIELLAVLDPDKIGMGAMDAPFSFAVYNRDYLRHREGMSMLALQSANANDDRAQFMTAGAATPDVFEFDRKASLPDGREVDLGFALAFANHPLLRHAITFSCQHKHPAEYFYHPKYQAHANGAVSLGKVFLTHWAAEAVEDFFVDIKTGHLVDVLHADELIERFGLDDPELPDDGFAGFQVLVPDLAGIADAAQSLGAVPCGDDLIIPPSNLFGVMMVISPK
ncbi:MAG: VOC family protein [Pseudomonadota bacterium]